MDYDWIIDTGYVPHSIIRWGTRRMQKARQADLRKKSLAEATEEKMRYIEKLRTQPMVVETEAANQQQYEIATGVFDSFLGPRMKYSCSLFRNGNETLAEAETAMLEEYLTKAELRDGMTTLFLAEQLPNSKVVGFSNSRTQKQHIDSIAAKRNIKNVELFEHMKNYELLMAKIARLLKPSGKLFVHLFSHRSTPYDFDDGWMSRYFFSGGTMPSADLLVHFQRDLTLQNQWWLSGMHYSKTLQCWLASFLKNKESVWPYLVESCGESEAATWYNRWVVYHIAGAEFFATEDGEATGISHYLFEKPETK
ncbi:SAM-dependent methyltransferase [Diaporthe sp. PMI_573]|nr:SAM-dependent methyltransferase [Diaporthaceae sp. PMI_573]